MDGLFKFERYIVEVSWLAASLENNDGEGGGI